MSNGDSCLSNPTGLMLMHAFIIQMINGIPYRWYHRSTSLYILDFFFSKFRTRTEIYQAPTGTTAIFYSYCKGNAEKVTGFFFFVLTYLLHSFTTKFNHLIWFMQMLLKT